MTIVRSIRSHIISSPYLTLPPFIQNDEILRTFRQLCIMLWVTPDDDFDGADGLFAIATMSFEGVEDKTLHPLFPAFVRNDIINAYGTNLVLERIYQSLNRSDELGAGLRLSFFVGTINVLICPDFWPYLSEQKIFPALAYAMNQHLEEYPVEDDEADLLSHLLKLA